MLAAILGLIERLVASWFGGRERDARNYSQGASDQREASYREAERQEEIADAAAQVARDAIPDGRDYRD